VAPSKSLAFLPECLVHKILLGVPHESPERDVLRDSLTVSERTRKEGLSFLTKTLPLLGKSLDEGLENGKLQCPRQFKTASRHDSRPAFLQASFKLIFDSSGLLLQDPCPSAVKHIRQVCFCFYKYELPYSAIEEQKAYAKFFEVEEELRLQDDFNDHISLGSSFHLGDLFRRFDPLDIVPRHGPGAVATGERLWEKFSFKRIPKLLSGSYNTMNYFMVGGFNELEDRWDWWQSLDRDSDTPSKVVLVPKDSRGPRLISSESCERMFIQQGLSVALVKFIESHPRMGGQINFTDQTINRRLSQEASITAKLATVDLAEASDRISLKLVERLFRDNLFPYLNAVRSTHTVVNGLEVPLFKHAPMGSAVCFPILAVTIWSLLSVGLSQKIGISLRKTEKMVFVYGDDLIIPVEHFHLCTEILESVGLKVNVRKSFYKGHFRESCGMDAFMGVDVTPVRVKTLWTGRRSDGQAYVSFVALANNLRAKGYEDAFKYLVEVVEATYGCIPYVTPSASGPGILVSSLVDAIQKNSERALKQRRQPDCQFPEVRASFLCPKRIDVKLDGWPRLLRALLSSWESDPSVAVVPRSAKLKRGWLRIA
jgi:hypothetical protein